MTDTTSWTPALDTFEANLRRLDAALEDSVAWEELALDVELPAFDGPPTRVERERFLALQERAATTLAAVRDKMDQVRTEQLAGDKKVAAARVYGRADRARR